MSVSSTGETSRGRTRSAMSVEIGSISTNLLTSGYRTLSPSLFQIATPIPQTNSNAVSAPSVSTVCRRLKSLSYTAILARRGFSVSTHFFHGPSTYVSKADTRLGISSKTNGFSGSSGFGMVSRWPGSDDGLSRSNPHGINDAGGVRSVTHPDTADCTPSLLEGAGTRDCSP